MILSIGLVNLVISFGTIFLPLASITLISCVLGEYFPDLKTPVWRHASIQDIKCPRYLGIQKSDGSSVGMYKIYKPDLSKELTRAGYFCHSGSWSTKCDTSFFGGRTINHAIFPMKPDYNRCIQAIMSYNRGDLERTAFPAPSCGWMTSNTEVQENIIIKDHRAHYDPVADVFMDILFTPTI